MLKRGIVFASLALIALQAAAQSPTLVRYHSYYQDSSRVVHRNVCYFIRGAHVNANDGVPVRVYDLVPAETDVIFFETTYDERLLVAVEIKKGATKVQLNSAKAGAPVWLTNFYGMSTRKQETRDFLTGDITLRPVNNNSEIIINGKLNIDSEYPNSHQEIIFDQSKLKISTLSGIMRMEAEAETIRQKRDQLVMEWASIMVKEKTHFWDSVFSFKKYPANTIEVTTNGNRIPDLQLHQSALFLDAGLTGQPAPRFIMFDKFNGTIGEDVLDVVDGNKRVLLLRFIHNDANYCVGVEIDGANVTKATILYRDDQLTISTATTSSVRISKDEAKSTLGTIDLQFETIRLTGTFELPKLQLSDIRDLEEKIKRKQQEYLASKR